MSEVDDNGFINDDEEKTYLANFLVCTAIVGILLLIHIIKIRSDLCTPERKSISFRREKPKITQSYKRMSYLTLISIIFYFLFELAECFSMADYSGRDCRFNVFTWAFPWTLAKATMYSVFVLRLHHVFGETSYGYPMVVIYCMFALAFIPAITIPILIQTFSQPAPIYQDYDEFPNPCWVVFANWINILFMSWDTVMNVLCLGLFMRPLRMSMGAVSVSVRDVTSVKRMTIKMVYVGTKLTIITFVATTTTIIFHILIIVRKAQFLYSFDMVINCVCLMLMTQYYPDDVFYERLCKLCLLVCPVEYRSNASQGANRASASPNAASKDTHGVVGHAAANYTANEAELAEVHMASASPSEVDSPSVGSGDAERTQTR